MRFSSYKRRYTSGASRKPKYSKQVQAEFSLNSRSIAPAEDNFILDIVPELPYFDVLSFAAYTGVSVDLLNSFTHYNTQTNYATYYIDKDTGRLTSYSKGLNLREINAPFEGLKELQLAMIPLLRKLPMHPANYAFVEGKNIKLAADSCTNGRERIWSLQLTPRVSLMSILGSM